MQRPYQQRGGVTLLVGQFRNRAAFDRGLRRRLGVGQDRDRRAIGGGRHNVGRGNGLVRRCQLGVGRQERIDERAHGHLRRTNQRRAQHPMFVQFKRDVEAAEKGLGQLDALEDDALLGFADVVDGRADRVPRIDAVPAQRRQKQKNRPNA